MKGGVDPASIYAGRKNIQSTRRAISGLTIRKSKKVKARRALYQPLLATQKYHSSTVKKKVNIPDSVLIPIMSIRRDPDVNVKKKFSITDKQLRGKSKFYVKFDVKDTFGKTVYSTTRLVRHSRQVTALNTPRRSPRILFSPYRRHGKNVMEVRQRDKTAEQIALFRKKIERVGGRLIDSRFESAGVLNISSEDGTEKFIDLVDNSKTYIYRAVPLGPNGEIGIRFASAVARGIPIRNSKKNLKITSVSITTKISDMGIEVRVASLPVGPIALKVVRRDMTLMEKEFTIINDPEPLRLISDPDELMLFSSTDLKEDHIYEFGVVLIFEDGDEDFGSQVSMIEYDALKTNVVETTTTAPHLNEITDNLFDVTFNLKTTIVPGQLDIVKKALEEQDLLAEFADALRDEREDLQKLITHTIIRTDLTSGAQFSLGLFVSGKFSDRRAAALSGAPSLKPGRSYRYTINPQLRSAETMFKGLSVSKQDPATGKKYSYRPSKFRNPITLKRGIIISAGKSSRISGKNNFELGNVGSPAFLTVSLPIDKPAIKNLRASKLDRDTVEITWALTGNVDLIDHFIVQAVKLDEIEFIGAAHNAGDVNSFKFYDELDECDQEIFYRIRMVYADYKRSSVSISNKVVV